MSKYLLIQTAIPNYRQNVLNCVYEKLGSDFKVLTGREYFEASVLTKVDIGSCLTFVDNVYLLRRKFLVQKGVLVKAVESDSLILELNPRILTVWLILLLRKLIGKKTVLWGHAWPRKGRYSRSDSLRNVLRMLGTHILVYTDTEKDELSERMPSKSITSAPNALYLKEYMWVPIRERSNFVYVGRLVAWKKPLLMIEAYGYAVKAENIGDLIIIGDGPERDACEALVIELGIQSNVKFRGHLSDISVLRDVYSECVASLSPGYVGLSITQSFSFGTPMIVADNEPHAPEIEAAIEKVNCCFFQAGNAKSMSEKMLSVWRERDWWKSQSPEIITACKLRYSAELMSSRIVETFKKCRV
ncbi:MAG: glycosyltransferase [Methylococcales symbiont of Hymedesmia sp. n. MRB-2018]|nr:MAG: glycosyltransferase [Methylococcales symbiont of Hymedesmia sp. n. MRB-2018]